VKGRFRYQNRVFFKLPFTLAPTVSDGQSSFEVVYYLKVRLSSSSLPPTRPFVADSWGGAGGHQVRTGTARTNGPFVVLGPLKIEQRRI
jgi:hypothetical protein